ncbi:MAG: STELLO glycosyltransferase family protein [Pyrinomonadaceae bacterium MAG19_C2-C3]|nr:STELLO glycosyltransferase family protein [Pyrinomonadaceae bacterium MAG19_C2-C3]
MNNQKKFIIITSIFPPTRAVLDFARLDEWQTIVVGDRKTPEPWMASGVRYVSVVAQESSDYKIAAHLPWNHYCRKMIGYVEAMRSGAEIIVDTDDDNIPKNDWAIPAFAGTFETTKEDAGFINVYRAFTDKHIWARGFPLNLINEEAAMRDALMTKKQTNEVGIWQGLADGDPDVDAIYRLTNNQPCYFKDRDPFVLARGTLSPFNSQNTAFRRELFPLLYLPSHVTFRFTDILRGLVAQPLMWQAGFLLGFTKATVVQERNPHDYLRDFESEIPCYLFPEKIIEIVQTSISAGKSLAVNLHAAYEALMRNNIVPAQEMQTLTAWLEDMA